MSTSEIVNNEDNKRIIGLYGEMCMAMELHQKGWQVYRAYIDEHVDFVVCKYYCTKCKCFSSLEKRPKQTGGTFPTDLCARCKNKSLRFIFRTIQVKASEGIESKKTDCRDYSFHAKLRSNVEDRSYYAWIALIAGEKNKLAPHFYIFNHSEISKFDDIELASYQKTDNQKIALPINSSGKVIKKSNIEGRSYEHFNTDFYGDSGFKKLDKILDLDFSHD